MSSLSRLLSVVWCLAILAMPARGDAATSKPDAASVAANTVTTAPGTPKTIEELARELSNPLAAFYRFDYELHYRTYQGDIAGADDQNGTFHYFQATIPYMEKNGKGWIFRFALPYFADQPIYWTNKGHAEWRMRQEDPREDGPGYWAPTHGHTDNLDFDLVYGGVSDSGLILNYGMAGQLPTTSDTSNAKQQLILGPEVNIGRMTHWGVYGAIISHVFDVAEKKDKNTPDTSITSIRGYLNYGLGHGWQLISNPVITYDWEGDSGNKLNLPLGGGIAKTTRISKMPLRISAEFEYYVASTDRFGPDLLLTFSLSPVIPDKHTRH
ncbi:MAG: hypothetical protein WBS20_12620 [Lysobacterales bacterium]